MAENSIKKIIIVGGGTAGWMSAAYLNRVTDGKFTIQLIESDEISTVGVGEATIPPLINFNTSLGINENEFVKATQASFKLGIQFNNWGAIGDSYLHGFGTLGRSQGYVRFQHYWLKMQQAGKVDSLEDFSVNLLSCQHNKFLRPTPEMSNSPLQGFGYAFHFDAGLYAKFLRGIAEKSGVIRTEGRIDSVQQHPETGFVTSVTMQNGDVHEADLFIDCSGFHGLLIEKTLETGFDDWSHWLPMNRAWAVPSESVSPLLPYTRSTAHSAGWQWRIPLQHRVGNGHVFCNNYISEDEARSVLMNNLDGEALAEPRLIKFTTGKRKKFWNKNVVAIGLASGFMEPLESTSIHLIQKGIARLGAFFPNKGFSQVDIDEFNDQSDAEFDQIRDFIILHYHASKRDDSEFWNYVRTMEIPKSLSRKIALYESNGRIFRDNNELFTWVSWMQVMHGQGIRAKGYHPLVDSKSEEQIEQMMTNMKRNMLNAVNKMPTHEEYIARNCKAEPMQSM
jgi:tryptophan halogenase